MMLRVLFVSALVLVTSGCGSGEGSDQGANTPVGISERPDNATCLAFNNTGSSAIKLTPIASGLDFSSPILMLPHPSLTNIFYVVQQRGRVYRVNLNDNTRTTLIDLSEHYDLSTCGECGLLGMAFHPNFAENGYLYFSFTENVSGMTSFVARFESADNGQTLRSDSGGDLLRDNLIEVSQPYSNHNGGHIAFGSDNLLYYGLGDGGSGNDPDNNGQTVSTLLGSMLRLNDDGSPASGNNVPGALPEIYAYGLRNPWRWSFDRDTGDLWLGDVGQGQYEEVDIITSGGNYGWRCYEGMHRTGNSCTSTGPYIAPVAEYDHSEGISITGGYVYRGDAIPGLKGVYVFADFGSGILWGLRANGSGGYDRETLLESGRNVASFAEGADGELYVVTFSGLFRIDPDDTDTDSDSVPELLSQTGCVNPDNPTQPASGLIPYTVIEPFWSDGADKQRFFALPNNTYIDVNAAGDFLFPDGSVLVKHFYLNGAIIETRLFMKQAEGDWRGYSYQWNETKTDATLVAEGKDVDYSGQTWRFPGSGECAQCHTSAAGFSLGLETMQLNRELIYPQSRIRANQLQTLAHINVFSAPLSDAHLANALPASSNDNATLEHRARAYLHSNCANCHQPGGTSQSTMDLRFSTALSSTQACDQEPLNGDIGVDNAKLISPGDASMSLIYLRMTHPGEYRMPPLASHQVDAEGGALIQDWINSLTSCD
ncbi:PQQ-dependent sugar dehydrogenase [Hahella sp. CR1]|uniref:SO2930 family diheme c-type cytochrome n=1 Tax=Hahella sp. CR1 TaxID=2992807 RepID=UPI002440F9A7|nr:SO2930 family diheme c-type cytochrome [Hahella sp. CR1]MDG9666475.1 PQQ-dependent sugar dehydrogenase [Hahella sp. CR1]